MTSKTLASADDAHTIRCRFAALAETDQRVWGSMPVKAMVCHMRDAYAMALGELTVVPVRSPLRGWPGKWLAFSAPFRWPRNYATVPELVHSCPSASFAAARAELLAKLVDFTAASQLAADHPVFGSMRHGEWMRWGYLHADHHLRQFGR